MADPKYSQLRNFVRESTPDRYQRIKLWMGACLVIVALGIDGFQFILGLVGLGVVVNSVISPAADFLFILWFWLCGVTFIKSPKRISILAIVAIIGLIPVLNLFPELSLGVLATVLSVWAEDGGGIIGTATNMGSVEMKKAA